jgi:hypothetical protein
LSFLKHILNSTFFWKALFEGFFQILFWLFLIITQWMMLKRAKIIEKNIPSSKSLIGNEVISLFYYSTSIDVFNVFSCIFMSWRINKNVKKSHSFKFNFLFKEKNWIYQRNQNLLCIHINLWKFSRITSTLFSHCWFRMVKNGARIDIGKNACRLRNEKWK